MEAAAIKKEIKISETIKTIYNRRSVRSYFDIPVDKPMLEKIIDAGRMAPSALNKQSWKFYVVTNRKTIQLFSKEIAAAASVNLIRTGPKKIFKAIANLLHFPQGLSFLKTTDPVFHGAPAVIFITAPKDSEWAALDIGMCSQNMMLAAKSMGLDSCPVGFAKYVAFTKSYSRLNIQPSEEVHLAIIFGYGNEVPELHKKIRNNVVFID